jgi:hypothetical protein
MTNEFAIRYASKIGMTVSRLGVPSNGSLTACGYQMAAFDRQSQKCPVLALKPPMPFPEAVSRPFLTTAEVHRPRSTHVVENSTEKS